MHVCMILDPDVCRYDECVYDACIYDPRSLTLIHVCMMHISMFLDPNACLYDAPMYDAYIYDPHSLSLMFVSMMRYFLVTEGRKEGRKDGQADSRSRIFNIHLQKEQARKLQATLEGFNPKLRLT